VDNKLAGATENCSRGGSIDGTSLGNPSWGYAVLQCYQFAIQHRARKQPSQAGEFGELARDFG